MRKVNTKTSKPSDRFWTKTYARRGVLEKAVVLPNKVILLKKDGSKQDVTTEYIQGYTP